jgi:hypothetical protein
MELLKHLSDKILIAFLKFTSGFAQELTRAGQIEQRAWHDQRRHFLKGLSLMAKRRYSRIAEPLKK